MLNFDTQFIRIIVTIASPDTDGGKLSSIRTSASLSVANGRHTRVANRIIKMCSEKSAEDLSLIESEQKLEISASQKLEEIYIDHLAQSNSMMTEALIKTLI